MLLGVNVAVVIFAVVLSVMLTVPETALLELSTKVKVLLVIVELTIKSLKVTVILETFVVVFSPSAGEVEDTVGAVVSIPPFVPAIIYLSKVSSFLAHEYTISRISPEIRLVFIIDSSEKETDTK